MPLPFKCTTQKSISTNESHHQSIGRIREYFLFVKINENLKNKSMHLGFKREKQRKLNIWLEKCLYPENGVSRFVNNHHRLHIKQMLSVHWNAFQILAFMSTLSCFIAFQVIFDTKIIRNNNEYFCASRRSVLCFVVRLRFAMICTQVINDL